MAKATIRFTDDNIDIGRYAVDVNVADAHTDDGLASAAHVVSMFIAEAVNTPQFAEGAASYGKAKGWSMRKDTPVSVTMILTDEDLKTGQYRMEFAVDGEAEIENSVTAAYMTACFARDAMSSNEFKVAVTDFAYRLTEGRDDASVNEPGAPPYNPPSNEEQVAA